jgi:DNA-binding Xre family transcriptional regulator
MTMRHLVDGLMQATKCANHCRLAWTCDVEHSTISLLHNGKANDMALSTLAKIHDATGVPVERMFAWYRLPETAVLGRVNRDGSPA